MKDLPAFRARSRENVIVYITRMLTNEHHAEESQYHDLIAYPDGHYRVLFNPQFFVIAEGQDQPSKSQWNSLKKKMKRHDDQVFVFKDYGEIQDNGERYYYLDFGFLANRM